MIAVCSNHLALSLFFWDEVFEVFEVVVVVVVKDVRIGCIWDKGL